MYKVLEIQPAEYNNGGTEQFIEKNIKYIDRNVIEVDFLCCGKVSDKKAYKDYREQFRHTEVLNIGYSIFRPWIILMKLFKYLKSNRYDIVHIHNGFVLYLSISALAAKLSGIKHIVCHLHGTDIVADKNVVKRCIKKVRKKIDLYILGKCATHYFTCSKKAAELSFGNKFLKRHSVEFFPNAIELDQFRYDISKREDIRQQYNIKNQFVIGTVGRLSKEKNQVFLVDIFNELCKKQENCILMIVGDGSIKTQLQDKIKELNLEDRVIFTGSVNNVHEYLQVFDVFVLPSFTEAYPIVMVEAQAAGLPIIVSDVVTKETAITNLVSYVSLNKTAEEWANKILEFYNYNRVISSIPEKYNLKSNNKKLEQFYINIFKNM